MKLFITGGTGYLGQELIKTLLQRNHQIIALVRSPKTASTLDPAVTHIQESFYKTLEQVSGKKPPVINIPSPFASVAGYGEYLLAQLFGREPSLLTHEVVEIYKSSWAFDSSLAKKELGYKITPLEDGLKQLVGWMKQSGLIN